jgi:hypothetical protein
MNSLDEPAFQKMLSLTYDSKGTVLAPTTWGPNDIQRFEKSLRRWIHRRFPAIMLYGYAWVGEVQPASKVYHYHLVVVTSKRLHFARDEVFQMWARGFVKVTVARSPFYLVSYVKKKDQKDYFYFPQGAHGFAVWISPTCHMGGQEARAVLRWQSLKWWQQKFLGEHGTDVGGGVDFAALHDLRAPPSGWVWAGAYYHKDMAEARAAELMADRKSS